LAGFFAGVPDIVMFVGWSGLALTQQSFIRKIAISHRLHRRSIARSLHLADQNETVRT